MIKAIIFDFYGVIRSDEYHDWLTRHGLKKGDTKSSTKQLNRGLMSVDQFFEELSQISHIPADKIRQEFQSHASLNERLLQLIIELKKTYRVAILSNANSPYLRRILEDAAIDKLFDVVVTSSEIGYIKPSTEIFQHTLDELNVKAQETIFIDDNVGFIEAARKIGLNSLLYTDFDSLTKKLQEMGIINS